MKQIFETDWLASQSVFYNELTGRVSYNINDVIDFNNIEFHPEGLNNYLDFGCSILEQTPIKHIKFLRHSSRLTIHDNGKLEIEYLEDPVDRWLGKTTREDDVFHLLYKAVRDWERSVGGEIIVPTSGGYDSRLLNFIIGNKSRIRSFTYGISENQALSYEGVYAKKLSQILGTRWEQIPLGDFHLYFEEWDKSFGISTHAHGMYHIEFYKKILPKITGKNPLLTGIIGDIWAGNLNLPDINSYAHLQDFGYTHGINADSTFSSMPCARPLLENYYMRNRKKITLPQFRVVASMRFKIILLSYLSTIPRTFEFRPWSPFLMPEIALSMLMLSPLRRKNRLWQKEFFQKHGLDLESMGLQVSYQNNLDHQAMRRLPVNPLNIKLLREVVKPSYVRWINNHVSQHGVPWDWFWQLSNKPIIGKAMRHVGIKEQRLKAYNAYLTLRPIQNLLEKRGKKNEIPYS